MIFRPSRNGRASKRQKTSVESDEEEFQEEAADVGYSDDGMYSPSTLNMDRTDMLQKWTILL